MEEARKAHDDQRCTVLSAVDDGHFTPCVFGEFVFR